MEWKLADTLRLGDYGLRVRLDGQPESTTVDGGWTAVRVSRYELPTFTVKATLDRSYYLPGQDAHVVVDATYLFGEPVTSGSVRVVHRERNHWDVESRKWVAGESEEAKAALDPHGRASLTLSLAAPEPDLGEFEDRIYAAFVTDASTGRTEQRRFVVRVSAQPVHVYIVNARGHDDRVSLSVTVCYPDGTPAAVPVSVGYKSSDGTVRGVRTTKASRYGVATFSRVALPDVRPNEKPMPLVVEARLQGGRIVQSDDVSWWSFGEGLDIETARTVHREGDAIAVSIRGGNGDVAIVDVIREARLLYSTRVRLRDGEGSAVIPYREDFRGVLRVMAYSLAAEDTRWRYGTASRAIIYPHDTGLQVKVGGIGRSYRPQDTVAASIRVVGADGLARRSAIGVDVVDKAVDERARSDREFSSGAFGFWNWGWRDSSNVGGLSVRDLERLDLRDDVPSDVDEAASVLLYRGDRYFDVNYVGAPYEAETFERFHRRLEKQLAPLDAAARKAAHFPTTEREFAEVFVTAGIESDALVDPWGTPFRFRFGLQPAYRTIAALSAGPDKTFDSPDDLTAITIRWNYFTPSGTRLDQIVNAAFARTGRPIRDLEALRAATRAEGLDIDALRDPWGEPFTFDFLVRGSSAVVEVLDRGHIVWSSPVDYFAPTRRSIDAALLSASPDIAPLPGTYAELAEALTQHGFRFEDRQDAWGSAYYATALQSSRYADEVVYSPELAWRSTAVTQTLNHVEFWSPGPDMLPGTADDMRLYELSQVVAPRNVSSSAKPVELEVAVSAGTGGVAGVVMDPQRAVIPGVDVTCRPEAGGDTRKTVTDGRGRYLFRDLQPGLYRVEAALEGFETFVVRRVPVTDLNVTTVGLELHVGRLSETVTVTGASSSVNAAMGERSSPASAQTRTFEPQQVSTPRVRDAFPETLYWAPSIVTDAFGTTKVAFRLADTMTAWKMGVVASTVSGEIGYAEAEIVGFQPFFLEHEPPSVLTVGDEIDMPALVRNYLGSKQEARVTMQPEPWFEMLGPATQSIAVAPSASAQATFPVRAKSTVPDGSSRVTATSQDAGDGIEKRVRVHPNGRETHASTSGLVRGSAKLQLNVPPQTIAGSLGATLRLYPNPLAVLVAAMEANLQRPYGCGEQTISAAYPGLLLLMQAKAGVTVQSVALVRAERYVRSGLEKLAAAEQTEGGFAYWPRGRPEAGLTAYATRFLSDAAKLSLVDESSVDRPIDWLLSQQRDDGLWEPWYGDEENLTAFVAATLARVSKLHPKRRWAERAHGAVKRALDALRTPREPYARALVVLAAEDAGFGDRAKADSAVLETLARREAGDAYWVLETNTAFFGWGLAGRLESTALAVTALSGRQSSSSGTRALVDAGVAFLMRQQDRYGAWYSGQTTVLVLEALLQQLGGHASSSRSDRAVVTVNGRPGPAVDLDVATDGGPVVVDMTRFLAPGPNSVEIQTSSESPTASVQLAAAYYVPWDLGADDPGARQPNESTPLRLAAKFDKTTAAVGETVQCTVNLERVGHRGYGMLIVEAGLPPGADVDRATLERAVAETGWGIGRYEVLPDRVVFYVWPEAGGSRFTFAFRPRMALRALTAPSVAYDYYNPENETVVPPVRFAVTARDRQ